MRRFLHALRPLQTLSLTPASTIPTLLRLLSSSSSAAASSDSDSPTAAPPPPPAADADFDSAEYELPTPGPAPSRKINNPVSALRKQLRFDPSLRARADEALFGERMGRAAVVVEEDEERSRDVALALLDAAMEPPDEDEDPGEVREEDQMSLSVGIVGAPNAGKSSLTNTMVGTKVAAVSRKTNTTTHEILGVLTKGNTQIVCHCTEFLLVLQPIRVESAWSSINLYDLLIVMFDVNRHLNIPDSRVIKLIKRLGTEVNPNQRRILCMNKVDLVEDKKELLKVAKEFEDLPGYERFVVFSVALLCVLTISLGLMYFSGNVRYFMVSGLKGKGVKDLVQYLMEQAVRRPWDEEPTVMTEEVMKTISLEEIPYVIEHRLMDWKELKDGSLRVEQHFITPKQSQRQILVGKNGSKIGRIGIEANEELRSIFKRNVHLILQVRVAKRRSA
ncbi:hypothetical protein HU200_056199 [Digitaria exilis]|uniref:KH type-2 domain-containing protein n=1 Tax=Digitaria exilis TaxID=1010633 RepID=A0A835AEI0_9POAL|nr:hypothetical protein HU200_056199 [Digitaria exilis]